MPSERITTALVRKLKPSPQQVFVYDTEVMGFAIRIAPGGTKCFVFSYRVQGSGRQRLTKIGRWGVWSVLAARDEARKLRQRVDKGEDPQGERREVREAPDMNHLFDRYVAEHLPRNKPGTIKVNTFLVKNLLRPSFGSHKIHDVSFADITRFHSKLRKTPSRANNGLAVLKKMFNLAERWGYRLHDGKNPCRGVERYAEKARERFFSDEELERLGMALRSGMQNQASSDAIAVLLFCGARVSEVLGLRWTDIDLKAGTFKLDDAKAGPRTVVLSTPAQQVLAGIDRSGGHEYAFVLNGVPLDYSRLRYAWGQITEAAGLPDAHIHDLRRTYATRAAYRGYTAVVVSRLLGQKSLEMANRYIQQDRGPLQEATERVSGELAAALKGGHKAEVVSIK